MKVTTSVLGFILSSVFIIYSFTWIINYLSYDDISSKLVQRVFRNNISHNSSSREDDIRILIGIRTLPDRFDRRYFLRMIYSIESYRGAEIDIKFVFCNLTKTRHKVLVSLEIMQYDDIIILNCKENILEGKAYTFFSSLPEMVNNTSYTYPPYHYVMRADDQTYFRLENLVQSLRPLPREDLYYGFMDPCNNTNLFEGYMAGMGYLVSWDLVEWVRESEIPKTNSTGNDDTLFEGWLRAGHKARNRFDAKWYMNDIPDPPTACTPKFWPDTIAVHKLKNQVKWMRTLNYFNVTQNLKPSKLYHIP